MNLSHNNKFCVFCCKIVNGFTEIQRGSLTKIKKFVKVIERLTWTSSERDQLQSLPFSMPPCSFHGCCDDCVKIVESFCEIYHQMQCLELQLNWNLSKLVDSINLANRIPSRWNIFGEMLRKEPNNDPVNIKNIQFEFRTFRENIMKAAKRKLVTSVPRVQLTRNEQTLKNAISKDSVPKIVWSPARMRTSMEENICNANTQFYGDSNENSTVFIDVDQDFKRSRDLETSGHLDHSTETIERFGKTPIEPKLDFPLLNPVSFVKTEIVSETTSSLVIENVISVATLFSPVKDFDTVGMDKSNGNTSDEDRNESSEIDICGPNEQTVDEQKVFERKPERSETNVKLALVAQNYLKTCHSFKGSVDKHVILLQPKRKEKIVNMSEGNISDNSNASDEKASKKRKPVYKKYTKNSLLAAINEVQEGKLSALEAAHQFGIPPRTLYDKLKGWQVNPTGKYLKERVMFKKSNKIHRHNVDSDESSRGISHQRRTKSKRLLSDSSSDTKVEDRNVARRSDRNDQVYCRNRLGKKTKQYTVDDMRLAIKAVQGGMSYRSAREKYGVPDRTIRSKMQNDAGKIPTSKSIQNQ